MKAAKSSLYREIENLILWFIPVGNNIPKDFALRKLGERMLGRLKHFWKVAYVSGITTR